jgi:GT2 family glycosyltransferase
MIGIVAIGRNEGERLRTCLAAAVAVADARVVYVDSNSTDGSVAMARAMGVHVVELDLSIPFTAARARNEGFRALMRLAPEAEFVQFLDGDCELRPDWVPAALAHMAQHPKAAAVCGRRRERFPDASIYNRLADMEWDTPVGNVKSCGGDALLRVSAFKQVNGYNDAVIAGEEPEMCVRLRAAGWEIWRINREMTLHDAAMTRLGQWWKRNLRAGHAYAEGHHRHGAAPERFAAKQVRSNWLWGLLWLLPLAWPLHLVLFLKVAKYRETKGDAPPLARLYARYTVLGKLPQMLGQLKFHWNRIRGKRATIIEYKGAAEAARSA